jgi:hypothetical protein
VGPDADWMLRQGNAPLVVLVEEPDRTPFRSRDARSFWSRSQKAQPGAAPLGWTRRSDHPQLQDFAGDRGLVATAKATTRRPPPGCEAAAA